MFPIWLVARSVLIEAVRRREVYVVVLLSTILLGFVMTLDFFQMAGLAKFYREMALRVMSFATAITVVVLAARQLPREFETRTIYPLLAKPISRASFVHGKLLGVMLAAGFCFAMFMTIFLLGSLYLRAPIPFALFLQYIYLQMLQMAVLACLSFLLSLLMNLDAAITFGLLFFATSAIITNALMAPEIFESTSNIGRLLIQFLNYAIPQLTLLDLSERTTHAWPAVPAKVMALLTGYAAVYAGIYYGAALLVFRRRPL